MKGPSFTVTHLALLAGPCDVHLSVLTSEVYSIITQHRGGLVNSWDAEKSKGGLVFEIKGLGCDGKHWVGVMRETIDTYLSLPVRASYTQLLACFIWLGPTIFARARAQDIGGKKWIKMWIMCEPCVWVSLLPGLGEEDTQGQCHFIGNWSKSYPHE